MAQLQVVKFIKHGFQVRQAQPSTNPPAFTSTYISQRRLSSFLLDGPSTRFRPVLFSTWKTGHDHALSANMVCDCCITRGDFIERPGSFRTDAVSGQLCMPIASPVSVHEKKDESITHFDTREMVAVKSRGT